MREFWSPQQSCVFDIQILYTDAPFYLSKTLLEVLKRLGQTKKLKYEKYLQRRRRYFVSLIFSVNSMFGKKYSITIKRLSGELATKWDQNYNSVYGYVRAQIIISLVRLVSICIRDCRITSPKVRYSVIEDRNSTIFFV